jgi:glutamine synthetase
LIAGADGVERKLDPGPQDQDPYNAKRPMLPARLTDAIDALERDTLFRGKLGDVFVDYYVKLKRNEAGRYAKFLKDNGLPEAPDQTTAWEHNEYFDFF